MSKRNCTYRFKGPDGQEQTIQGMAAMKAFLANGGLEFFYPDGKFPWLKTEAAQVAPKAAAITDFGEKIGGAKKDLWTGFKDDLAAVSDDDIAGQPLSKVWPAPDYQALIESGTSPEVVAFIRAARDEIPAKPRVGYKVKGWASKVKTLRSLALDMVSGKTTMKDVQAQLEKAGAISSSMQGFMGRVELYQAFGHGKPLDGIRMSWQHYTLYRGQQNVSMWVVEQDAKATAWSNFPRELATGKTKEEAIESFRKAYEKLGSDKEAKKGVQFDIISYRGQPGYWISKKLGRNHVKVHGPLETVKEAREYRDQNQAELVAKLEKIKEIPNERRETNEPRVGEDMRNGTDVTPELFGQTFGFRGVEFGNWVEQGRRQRDLNDAFDALMDMAAILGIPPKAISLNGQLGLAFGARGTGGNGMVAAAHYEPNKVVINLTKKSGAGSLGHEWWHAVDNYFAKMRKEQGGSFMTTSRDVLLASRGSGYVPYAGVRPEMIKAFGDVVKAINLTGMKQRASVLDGKRSNEYWTSGEEMSARAYEAYLITKLQDQNASNDYLANIVSEEAWNAAAALGLENENSYPYPVAKEVPGIRAAFDNFFQTVQTREGDNGNVALFSVAPDSDLAASVEVASPAGSISQVELDAVIKGAVNGWKAVGGDMISTVESWSDLPSEIIQSAKDQGLDLAKVEGVQHRGKVYLVRQALTDRAHAERVLFHEVLGHLGLKGALSGKTLETLKSLWGKLGGLKGIQAMAEKIDAGQGGTVWDRLQPYTRGGAVTLERQSIIMDELIAYIAQGNDQRPMTQFKAYLSNLKADVVSLLRKLNLTSLADKLDKAGAELDVLALVRDAREAIETGKTRDGKTFAFTMASKSGPGFSVSEPANKDQTQTEAFKRWFGDWRALAAQKRLDSMSPVKINVPPEWRGLSLDDLRQRVRESLEGLAASGEPLHHPEIGDVEVTRNTGVRKSLSTSRDPAKLYVLGDLRKAFESSLYASETPAGKDQPNVASFEKLLARVEIDDSDLVAVFTVRRMSDGRQFYNTVTLDDGKSKTPAVSPRDTPISGERATSANTGVSGEFSRKSLERVNPGTVSKVVDADGRPRVMYHGTAQDIAAFRPKQAGAIFVTDDPTFAADFAARSEFWMLQNADKEGAPQSSQNIMPVYVKAKNPFDYDNPSHIAELERYERENRNTERAIPSGQIEQVAHGNWESIEHPQVQAAIKALGHDAFYAKEDGRKNLGLYDPAQLKSAIGNSGNFDPSNADVRFSIASSIKDKVNERKTVIVGSGGSRRVLTPEQTRAMSHVGFQVEEPSIADRAKALWKDAGKKLAQGLADQFAPVKELDGKAYSLLRLAKGASGAFEVLLQGGKLKLTDGVYDFDASQRGGVIDKLLKPLGGEHHYFLQWVAANRAERLMAEGKENLFTKQDIADLKTLATGQADFDYTIQNGVRKGQVTRDRATIYADSLVTFNGFNKNVLDMAEQSGLIDGDSRSLWEQEFYVPFYRVADEMEGGVRGMNIKGGAVRQEAFKKLKGGKQALNADLLDNTLMNWAHLLDAAAKNRAAKATLEAAANMGVAVEAPESTVQQMGKSINKKGGAVWFMDGGVKRHFLVDDPYLMTAITSLEYAGMRGPMMDAMGAFKHALTLGVTASPFFKVRNLIRDSLQVVAVSKIGVNPLSNVKEGWKLTDPHADAYFRLMAGGGTIHLGTMLEGSEGKRVQALVESGVSDATILNSDQKVKAFYRRYIEPAVTAYNELGNRGEAVNRAALYNQLIEQGVSHAEASLMARDLMDFSMQGSFTSVRFLTQVVPFLNARIQGLYKLGKAAKEDPQRFAAVIGATALMSVALLAAYSDDDDWKKREDWDRNNYWWFKLGGTAFRIPKPFEIGAMATLAERGVELLIDDEMTGARFRQQLLTLLGDNLSMNPIPQLVKPMLDVYANKDSFSGRPIETMGMERLLPEYRFNDRTSMLARGASSAVNAVTGLVDKQGFSPVQIDHMIRGYFGWLGSFIVGASDILARHATDQPDRATPDYWKTATGGIVSSLDGSASRYVSQMYEQSKAIEQAYGTWRTLLKEGHTEEAQAFREEHAAEISANGRAAHFKKVQSTLNSQIRAIERSSMGSDEKREAINAIRERQDQAARGFQPAGS